MTNFVELADQYSIEYNDALCRFCTCGVMDEKHQAELESELNYIIEKVKEHLYYAKKYEMIDTISYLNKELEKLNEFLEEVTNPDVTPIMEK